MMNFSHKPDDRKTIFSGSPLSQQILDHDGLLTPVLCKRFGRVFVDELQANETADHYFRHSVIRQSKSDQIVLYAKLVIQKRALPELIIDQLHNTKRPFGQLLLDAGYQVGLKDQRFFVEQRHGEPCYGRSHTIHLQKGVSWGEPICEVKERLVGERSLAKLVCKD